jgi:hypothetical protein
MGPKNRLLRRESPALQEFADSAYDYLHATLALDQQHHRSPRPERKVHLQLLRALLLNYLPDQLLLLIGQLAGGLRRMAALS